MAEHNKSPATYDDIEVLPPHVVGEMLFGTLYSQLRLARRHITATACISGQPVAAPPFDAIAFDLKLPWPFDKLFVTDGF